MNAHVTGFISGKLYRGPLKAVCVPGLNCYSCPGALGSCPIGALQAVVSNIQFLFSFYVVGVLMFVGALAGRAVCGWVCPFGFIQELLYKIPSPKLGKSGLTRKLSKLKYAVLAVFVLALPLMFLFTNGVGVPAFCAYICPAGTLEAGLPLLAANPGLQATLGWLFALKAAILAVTVLASVLMFRPFCRFICPLGAIYSLFNRVAIFGVRLDGDKCSRCGKCASSCLLDVKIVNDSECMRCGKCAPDCPCGAIKKRGLMPWTNSAKNSVRSGK